MAGKSNGGWEDSVYGPSEEPWDEHHAVPHALTVEGIQRVVAAFKETARRAVEAGVDTIQIHSAHGYLLHSFLSGAINKRTDNYGGSFENRTRLLWEIIAAVREVIPETMPLQVRVSGTDWLDAEKYPEAWEIEQTVRLAKELEKDGRVDLLDVSSGGNHKDQQIVGFGSYQIDLAEKVSQALGEKRRLVVTAVGGIAGGAQAEEVLQKGQADAVCIGRAFLREPSFVGRCARELGVETDVKVINQYHRAGRWVPEVVREKA